MAEDQHHGTNSVNYCNNLAGKPLSYSYLKLTTENDFHYLHYDKKISQNVTKIKKIRIIYSTVNTTGKHCKYKYKFLFFPYITVATVALAHRGSHTGQITEEDHRATTIKVMDKVIHL